jgi:hypothetical protein
LGGAYHSLDRDYKRMMAETNAFITWGLKHPQSIKWIPKRPIDTGSFTFRATLVFWTPILCEPASRALGWVRSLLKR